MRKSQLRTLEALKTLTAEANGDRDMLNRSIAHEQKVLLALDAAEADELRIAKLEFEERQSRWATLFSDMRENARAKIGICEQQLKRLEDGLPLDERQVTGIKLHQPTDTLADNVQRDPGDEDNVVHLTG